MPNPVGRPTDYSPELSKQICEQIVLGHSLRTICREESMPCVATLFNWFEKHPEFLEQYEKAKELQADTLAEEMLDIADDGSNDWMEKHDKDGENIGWQINGEHVQRSRLRLDTRKWVASKLKPKKYGERVQQEITGKDGGPIETKDISGIETAKRIAFLLSKGANAVEDK